MSTENMTQVLDKIDVLANKLGMAGTEVFSWYVREIYIGLFTNLAILSVSLLVCGISFLKFKALPDDKQDGDNPPVSFVIFVIAGVAALISLLFLIFDKGPIMLNVNYHALNDLFWHLNR